jgi:hypothetical protein
MSMHTFFEYGYRLACGREVWQEQGKQWIDVDTRSQVGFIYLDSGEGPVAAIEQELSDNDVEGSVIRRQVVVVTGPVQQHLGGDQWQVSPSPEQFSLDRLVAESRRLRGADEKQHGEVGVQQWGPRA